MSIIDPYFVTGLYPVYMIWMKSIRERLLNLNVYKQATAADVIERERTTNFYKNKLEAEKSIIKSEYESNISDDLSRQNREETKELSSSIELFSKEAAEKTKADFLANIKASKQKMKEDVLKHQQDLVFSLNKRERPEFFGEEGNDAGKILNPEASPTPEYLDYTFIKNNYTYPSIPNAPNFFPQAGKDITKTLTDEILNPNRFKYNFFSGGEDNEEYRGWIKIPGETITSTNKEALNSLNKINKAVADKTKFYGTPAVPLSEYSKEILSNSKVISPTGTYKFFIEKLHGRYYSNGAATPYSLNPISETQGKILEPNGINFSNRKVFAAFIDNYNDSYSVENTPYDFIGRGERVYAYRSTERKITLEFTILTDHALDQMSAISEMNEKLKTGSEDDILSFLLNQDTIHWGKGVYNHDFKQRLNGASSTHYDTPETTWQKLTFLAQCCYPFYRTDGKMKEQPMVRMRIADFFDVVCHFNNLNVQLNPFDAPYIDFNSSALGEQPMGLKILIDATIIHDYEPSSQFYGFYHRKQFDSQDYKTAYEAKVWGIGLSKSADSLSTVLQKKSPISIKDVMNTKNLTDILKTTDFQEIQNDIKTFKENFRGLEDKSVNLFEHVRQIKLKNIFNAIKSIQTKKDFFNALEQINDKFENVKIEAESSIKNNLNTLSSTVETTKELAQNNLREISQTIDNFNFQTAKNSDEVNSMENAKNKMAFNMPKTIGEMVDRNKNKNV